MTIAAIKMMSIPPMPPARAPKHLSHLSIPPVIIVDLVIDIDVELIRICFCAPTRTERRAGELSPGF
jgi:hypothetical protein